MGRCRASAPLFSSSIDSSLESAMSPRPLLPRLRWRQVDQVFECRLWRSSIERRLTFNGPFLPVLLAESSRSKSQKQTLETFCINNAHSGHHYCGLISAKGCRCFWLRRPQRTIAHRAHDQAQTSNLGNVSMLYWNFGSGHFAPKFCVHGSSRPSFT